MLPRSLICQRTQVSVPLAKQCIEIAARIVRGALIQVLWLPSPGLHVGIAPKLALRLLAPSAYWTRNRQAILGGPDLTHCCTTSTKEHS